MATLAFMVHYRIFFPELWCQDHCVYRE